MDVSFAVERWPTARPFAITGHVWTEVPLLVVTLSRNGHVGRGEACGIYYKGETPERLLIEAGSLRDLMHDGSDRTTLQSIAGPTAARNAFDCALWDLEAKEGNRPAWQIAELDEPRPLLTTYTVGADNPDAMAARALEYEKASALKLKLLGDGLDAARVERVREARPDAWIGVDANQGFTRRSLETLFPTLIAARVELLEQPFPADQDHLLDGLQSPIDVAADESLQDLDDIGALVGRVDVVNIKLDKCGGLTRGLQIAAAARTEGLKVMVGNMLGTSLSMAPSFLLGQLCEVVDLDGPIHLLEDRSPGAQYTDDGKIWCPAHLWGSPAQEVQA